MTQNRKSSNSDVAFANRSVCEKLPMHAREQLVPIDPKSQPEIEKCYELEIRTQ
jgi:hypothetical protein